MDPQVRELFDAFLSVYVFQPATAFWRAIEVAVVVREPFPQGLGLDLGCGDGKLTQIVDERIGRRRWVGIDLNAKDVELAKERGLYDRLHAGSVASIPEPDGTFDFVFANSVVEHVAPIEETLSEISRVLKPGGVFVNTVPSSDYHRTLRGPLLPFQDRERYMRTLDRRMNHLRFWSLAEWDAAVRRHGMRIDASLDYLSRSEMQRYEHLVRMTSGLAAMVLGDDKTTTEMQETLGIRKQTFEIPAPLRRVIRRAMFAGVDTERGPFGGLYMRVVKT